MSNEICVVSYGGVFPGAKNPAELFSNLLQGKQFVHDFREPLPSGAFYQNLSYFFDEKRRSENRTYCPMGAFLDRRWTKEFAQQLQINHDDYTSAEIFLLEAAEQTLGKYQNKINFKNSEIILGATSIDLEYVGLLKLELMQDVLQIPSDSTIFQKIKSKLHKTNIPKERFTCANAVLNVVKKRYGIQGLSFLTDAACASSFSSLFVAQQRLRSKATEFVLSGGIETNLAPFLEVLFAKAGVLSESKICPFDVHSKGMNHGEAVALMLLCLPETVKKYNLEVLGVIEDCQGSSDGLRGGPTEPTLEGQMLSYQRVHGDKPNKKIHYIEAHGTGTIIGDKTELQSLDKFFAQEIPIGSVKANVGHTIGAAGTVALIKCLEIIKNRVIPPSVHFKNLPNTVSTQLFLNQEKIILPKDEVIHIPISSFGFGGTNFHLLLSSDIEQAANPAPQKNTEQLLLCSTEEILFADLPEARVHSKIRIPPKTVPHFDPMVLSGFLAIEKIMQKNSLQFLSEDLKKIVTLSAGTESLDLTWEINDSLALDDLSQELVGTVYFEKARQVIQSLAQLSADSGASVLNNLVAGRAAKMFNFQGPNFHIDADLLSRPVAYLVAHHLIQNGTPCVFVLTAQEKFNETKKEFERIGLRADLFCSIDFIEKYDLPVLSEIAELKIEG